MPNELEPGFKCPKCGKGFYVKSTRLKSRQMMIRYRHCKSCGHKQQTVEKLMQTRKEALERNSK